MIDRLYRGELEPSRTDYRTDPNYTKALADILASEAQLTTLLKESELQFLTNLTNAYARLGSAMTQRAFHDGFCVGMELVFDVLIARN